MSRNAADPFHYADANGNSSDDPLQTPSPVPCTLVGAAPWQADNARHIVQVRPNVRDTPTLRSIELWGEVAAPAGSGTIDRVWWTVLHPDGTHAAKVEGLLQVPSACAGPVGMFAAAKRTGQLSEAAVDEPIAGLVALCQSGADRLFHGMMTVSSKEPCGEYRVELHALAQGVEAVLASYVDVQCFIALDTNFATVNWGNISPGAAQVVQGGATLQSSGPAIENQGNAGVGFMVAFSPLVQANTQGQPIARSKAITSFGARFGAGGEHLQVVDPIEAGSPVSLGDGPYQVLCNGEVGALDLILHPGTQLAAGVYVGALTVIARAVAGNGQGNHQASADPHNKAVGLCYEDQGQIVPPAPP